MNFKTRFAKNPRLKISFPAQGRTKQSFKDECDINNIMKKFQRTGQLPDMIRKEPRYGDFADPVDFQDSMNLVIFAQEQFDALPAHVRERFANQPVRFLEFATNPANAEELVKMGLATKREPKPSPEPISAKPPGKKTPPAAPAEGGPQAEGAGGQTS